MRTYLPMLLALTMLSACNNGTQDSKSQSESESHSASHSHENVSGIREGIWPPEPLGMENEQTLPAQLRPRARQSVVDVARSAVMNNPDLRRELGDNYASFDASLSVSKSGDVASFVFYNYDTNKTIEATLGGDGTVTVQSQAANQWQPTENATEVEDAISRAQDSLEADGYNLSTLKGTAMLTYPTQSSQDENVPNFYDSRILYVTFGNGDGELPMYSARVDLSAESVSQGGPVQ